MGITIPGHFRRSPLVSGNRSGAQMVQMGGLIAPSGVVYLSRHCIGPARSGLTVQLTSAEASASTPQVPPPVNISH